MGGGAGVILVTASWSTVQHVNIYDSLASIGLRPAIKTSHLVLVDQKSLIVLLPHPIPQIIHVTVTVEWITMKVNLFLRVSKHVIHQSESLVLDVSDLVVAQVDVSQSLETVQGETDVSQLIVSQVNVKQRGKVTKHVIIFDLPDLILLQM